MQGNIDWTRWDHRLGITLDATLAAEIGCTRTAVYLRRKALAIPKARKHWTPTDQKLLEAGQLRCTACDQFKPIETFYKGKGYRGGRRRECPACIAKRTTGRREHRKRECIELLGGACQNCGFSEFLSSLQFHHVGDGKERNIAYIIRSPDRPVREELDKCCLLCANCHAAFHNGELPLTFSKQDLGWTVRKVQEPDSACKVTVV